jgi:hypothetical protein
MRCYIVYFQFKKNTDFLKKGSLLIRMRNVLDKIVEKIKTHILCCVTLKKNCHF